MNQGFSTNEPEWGLPFSELFAALGSISTTVLGPVSPGRLVRGVEFYDDLEQLPDESGLLLLVPSPERISHIRIAELAAHAADRNAAALVVKCRDSDTEALAAVAEQTGIPLVRVADQVSWRLFDSLLAQAFGERRHSDDAHRNRGAEPLFALVNELAEFFGGSVALEDLGRRLVAYSSVPGQLIDRLRTQGILTRSVPDSPFNDDQYRTVLRSMDPLKYPQQGDEAPRVAIAIRAGALPLGTIWAIDAHGDAPITPEQDERMRAAATVAAAHLLADIQSRRATQIPREARLRTLLDGANVTGSELAELGHAEERGSELAVFAPADGSSATTLAQLRSAVQRHLGLHSTEAVTIVRGERVYALFPHQPNFLAASIVDPLLPVIDRLIGGGTRISLPGIAHRSSEVAALRQLGDQLLDTAVAHPAEVHDRTLTVQGLRTLLILERVDALFSAAPELRLKPLADLAADEPALAETLLVWCANFGNVARTASELQVHENTVRYRLRHIETRHHITLSTADNLLTAWLELRAMRAVSG